MKAEKSNDIECISMVYGISSLKAREVLQILTQEQLKKIKETADIGGVGKK